MDINTPLLEKEHFQKKSSFDIRIKICIYSMIWGCALEMFSITETQYIYAYLKLHNRRNKTNSLESSNVTTTEPNNCESGNATSSTDDYIQGLASDWTWYIQLVIYTSGLVVMSIAGPLSDRIGRRPVLISNVGLFVITFGLRTYAIYMKLDLYWYLVFCAIEGISGCHYMFDILCLATITNAPTDNNTKSFDLALFDSAMVVGVCLADIGTGYLIKLAGYVYPFLTGTSLLLVLLVFIVFSYDDQNDSKSKSQIVREKTKGICSRDGILLSLADKVILFYLIIFMISEFPFVGYGTIRTLYLLGFPLCWSSVYIGWLTAFSFFWEFIIGVVILKLLLHFITDYKITCMGFVSSIICYASFGFVTMDWMVYAATAFGILRMFPIPLLKSIISRMVSQSKQGALFTNIYLLEAACRLGGSTVFNNIYHYTRSTYIGIVFFVMAGFPLVALVFFVLVTVMKQPKATQEDVLVDPTTDSHKNDAENMH